MFKSFPFTLLFFFTTLAYDHRPKEFEAALRRAAHPGVNSAFLLAQQVVRHLEDHQKWPSHIAIKTFPDCPQLQNCSNATNAIRFFECLAINIQSIIKVCLAEISDPDQLFNTIDERLQNYLKTDKEIGVECSADLSFHWISLMKLATAGAIQASCQGPSNVSDCSDLLEWATKAQSESLWALIRKNKRAN